MNTHRAIFTNDWLTWPSPIPVYSSVTNQMGQLLAKASVWAVYVQMHTWGKSSQALLTDPASTSFLSSLSPKDKTESSVAWCVCVCVFI